jgi:hypothetical protein
MYVRDAALVVEVENLEGCVACKDDYLGFEMSNLLLDMYTTSLDFLRRRLTQLGRAALDSIGNVDFIEVKTCRSKELIE